MKTKKLKRYIKELDNLISTSNEDIRLIAMLSERLEEIVKKGNNRELKGFTKTVKQMRDFAWTSSDYKFLDKVVGRLEKFI